MNSDSPRKARNKVSLGSREKAGDMTESMSMYTAECISLDNNNYRENDC